MAFWKPWNITGPQGPNLKVGEPWCPHYKETVPGKMLRVLQIVNELPTQPKKTWMKPQEAGHLLFGDGAYASGFASFTPLSIREHADTGSFQLIAVSTCLFIVCLLSLVHRWTVRLCALSIISVNLRMVPCMEETLNKSRTASDTCPHFSSISREQSILQTPQFTKWEIIRFPVSESLQFPGGCLRLSEHMPFYALKTVSHGDVLK